MKIVPGMPSDKYRYDAFAYDSPLEKENITADIEEVVVYGRISRNSIAIPTITGGIYSLDFMYVVKKVSGKKELNIVVETKDVEGKDGLRGNEAAKIECACVFFKILSQEGDIVHFKDQINNKQMAQRKLLHRQQPSLCNDCPALCIDSASLSFSTARYFCTEFGPVFKLVQSRFVAWNAFWPQKTADRHTLTSLWGTDRE